MTDHDLNDLIIGESERKKNSKGKGVLTIVALLVAILVIAIMMAQMVLEEKDENSSLLASENESIVSSELQLDESIKDEDNDNDELEDITTLLDRKSAEDNKTAQASSENAEVKPDIQEVNDEVPAPVVAPTNEAPAKVEPKAEPKPKVEPKPKPKPVEKRPEPAKKVETPKPHTSTGSYYIQVGSFTTKPSSQFLRVIKNSGFSYKLHNSGKLLIGSYSSREMANRDLARVKDRINKGAFIINIK